VVNPAPGTYRLTARAIDNLGGTTDSVPINVTIGDSTPLKIASISRSLNGSIGLSLSGPVGATNVIQVSNDLAHWSTATTFVNTTGTFQFNDSTPGDAARFYRVKQQ